MYFVFLFVYVYVFYIKTFTKGIDMLYNKKSLNVVAPSQHALQPNVVSDVVVQHDKLKGKSCNNHIVRLLRESINCESFCGKSYTKKTLTKINLYPGLDPGVYCIPKSLDTCHPYTGTIIKNLSEWSCVPKYPFVFAGPDADDIISCNGDIIDRSDPVNPVTYTKKIPKGLKIFDNPDREKNIIGEWRFSCPKRKDHMNNQYVPTDVSRLHTVRNVCSQMMVNDNGRSMPNFVTGKCECPTGYLEYFDDRVGPYCAPNVQTGGGGKGLEYFYEPCLKPDHPVNYTLKPCAAGVYRDDASSSLNRFEIGISTGGLSADTYEYLNKKL